MEVALVIFQKLELYPYYTVLNCSRRFRTHWVLHSLLEARASNYSWKKEMSHLMTKPSKWHVHPAKTQINLGICPVWSIFAVCMKKAWVRVHSEGSDQTGRMPRLIWVFAGRIVILLVLSWGSSNLFHRNSSAWENVHGMQRFWPKCPTMQIDQTLN